MGLSEQPLQWTEEHQKLAEKLVLRINIQPQYRHAAITGAWMRFRLIKKTIRDLRRWMLKNLKRGARDETKTHPIVGRSTVIVKGEKVSPSVQEFNPRKFESPAASRASHDKALIIWTQYERVLQTAEAAECLSAGEIEATMQFMQSSLGHEFLSPSQRTYIEVHITECRECSDFLSYIIEHPMKILQFCAVAADWANPSKEPFAVKHKQSYQDKAFLNQQKKHLQLHLAQLREIQRRYLESLLRLEKEIQTKLDLAYASDPTSKLVEALAENERDVIQAVLMILDDFLADETGKKLAPKQRACSVCGQPGHNAARHSKEKKATPLPPESV